jgi:transcriptional regulator with XRE-family HTH domain
MTELKQPEHNSQGQPAETWAARWGHLLRMARQVAGLSLSDVAERSGLSKGYLSKLESAHPSAANPSRATLAALARALPSTIPLIQKLDEEAGLPTARTLLRGLPHGPAGQALPPPVETEVVLPAIAESSGEGLPSSWTGWEILLAVMILENSGLGPPTVPVLARACSAETLSNEALAHLEEMGLLRVLPPGRPGGPARYTQGPTKLEAFGIHRPADFFIRAAITLFLKQGKNDDD